MQLFKKNIKTSAGPVVAYSDGKSLVGVFFRHNDFIQKVYKNIKLEIIESDLPVFKKLQLQLEQYFNKKRKDFNLPLQLNGSAFQKKAWQSLLKIPFGKTKSYGDQAKAMKSQAVRAIGSANGKNPFVIIIPCHRVVRSNGQLGGYSGGLEIKKYLLEIEGAAPLAGNKALPTNLR
ncbi:MAG: methylated-DNA--[protein]-cysteine S-methyltransferase [Pseudobdellovibrionaceae bacterium]